MLYFLVVISLDGKKPIIWSHHSPCLSTPSLRLWNCHRLPLDLPLVVWDVSRGICEWQTLDEQGNASGLCCSWKISSNQRWNNVGKSHSIRNVIGHLANQGSILKDFHQTTWQEVASHLPREVESLSGMRSEDYKLM